MPASNLILFSGDSYGGGLSATPLRRLTISGTFSRAISNTLSDVTNSRNNTEIFNAQLQYRLRKIGVLAGYTRFTQGISASSTLTRNRELVLHWSVEMDRFLLSGRRVSPLQKALTIAGLVALLVFTAAAAKQPKTSIQQAVPPELLLDGGRKLTFERSFSLEREVKPKRGFWTRVVDVIAGEPDFRFLVNPYSIATDSHGRVIVTDPGADGIHIFDFTEKKYKFLSRKDSGKNPMLSPQCVAVDAQDNIYVTDS